MKSDVPRNTGGDDNTQIILGFSLFHSDCLSIMLNFTILANTYVCLSVIDNYYSFRNTFSVTIWRELEIIQQAFFHWLEMIQSSSVSVTL